MKYLVLFLSLSLVTTLNAQTEPEPICGYETEVQRILKNNPNYIKWQNALFQQAMNEYNDLNSAKRDIIKSDTLYFEIPVVFHVLYNTTEQNINSSYIVSQMEELNLAFRKQNADTTRIRPIFQDIAADVRIQFRMADKDPQGNPTDGITRSATSKAHFAKNAAGSYVTDMKYANKGGFDAWDPTKYLNVWICNMQYPGGFGIVYGFATPPTNAPNWDQFGNATKDTTDKESGVVLHYKVVGRNNPLAPTKYSEGKTAIHEFGHYLGLRHIWGDGTSSSGCTVDDGIFDTPNAKSSNATCSGQNSCTDANNDLPDQTENYMDYALDGCAAMFTREQAYMMRYVLNTLRSGLSFRNITYDTIRETEAVFKVFPNPVSQDSRFNIEIKGQKNDYCNVKIFDMCGREVLGMQLKNNEIHPISSEGMACGLYQVVLTEDNGEIIERRTLSIW